MENQQTKQKKGCLFYGFLGLSIILALGFIGSLLPKSEPGSVQSNNNTQTESNVTQEVQKPAEPVLELLSTRIEREHGFIKVIGEVRNNSTSKIENLMIVVSFYNEAGDLVKTGEAMIDYNPIMPSQTSPFTTIDTDNPVIVRYVVAFKTMFGGTMTLKDSRK